MLEDDYDSEYPLRRPAAGGAAGPRRRRTRDLHRHVQQGDVPGAAPRLPGRAAGYRRRVRRGARGPTATRRRSSRRRSPTSSPRPLARHIRRMRTLYAERQGALVEARPRASSAARSSCSPRTPGCTPGCLPQGPDDRAVSARAAARGVEAQPLSAYSLDVVARGGLLLGYAGARPATIRRRDAAGAALRGVAAAFSAPAPPPTLAQILLH